MSIVEIVEENDGEGYFASVSDLMVGILFVFLLMLTVFALNYRDAEHDQKVEKTRYEEAVDRERKAERRKLDAEAFANTQAALAAAERAENDRLRFLLNGAVTELQRDIEDREEGRQRLLSSLERALIAKGVKVYVDPASGILRLSDDLLFNSGEPFIHKDKLPTLRVLAEVLGRVLPCYSHGGNRLDCEPQATPILETVLVEGHTDRQRFRGRIAPKVDRAAEPNSPSFTSGVAQEVRPPRQELVPLSPAESEARNDLLSTQRALSVFKELRMAQPSIDSLRNSLNLPLLGVSGYGERRPLREAQGMSADDYKKNRRIDLRFVLSPRTSEEIKKIKERINAELGNSR
jgi:flagellar motor protein MotB